ncbi:BH3 interacting domain death agonist isoform X2 [Enoplosus armatus]|uniref:BH3 interacting domain death agonist isoform X2 n=1 Tax=Enoplosus armatus TaxID=215367 RepID=UPI00399401A4
MDVLGNLTSGQNALVMLAFLQADCRGSEYEKELLSLGQEINPNRDMNCNGLRKEALDDGDLETDGHLSISIPGLIDDIQPSVGLQRPRNHAEPAVVQQIAEELREIADHFEHNVVAQATQNLSRNISHSPPDWKDHLTQEVDRVMRQGVGLENLPQERAMVALTLTLVKGVCEQAPRLLRNLFRTALQFISPARAR